MTFQTNNPVDEAQIRHLIDRWVAAFHNKSVEEALSVHAEGVISFDVIPPLYYAGTAAYRQPWEAIFAETVFSGPIQIVLRDLNIRVRDDIAFSYSLNRFTAIRNGSTKIDYWFRWTACYQKFDSQWLIVHDHSSLPTDFATGMASLGLAP